MQRDLRVFNHRMHQIGRMHHTLCENTIAGFGIHRSQHMILMRLYKEDGVSQKDLAERMQVSPAAMAVSLKKMENSGYIRRAASLPDSRTKQIFITEKGKAIVEETRRYFDSIDQKMFSGIAEEDYDAAFGILEKILANLEKALQEERKNV
ncbi:MAG: MarR family transcriptional regulator [Clostridia bacterium]|nr:MarR family transcriptional regulator [Clostridia bacterium]